MVVKPRGPLLSMAKPTTATLTIVHGVENPQPNLLLVFVFITFIAGESLNQNEIPAIGEAREVSPGLWSDNSPGETPGVRQECARLGRCRPGPASGPSRAVS